VDWPRGLLADGQDRRTVSGAMSAEYFVKGQGSCEKFGMRAARVAALAPSDRRDAGTSPHKFKHVPAPGRVYPPASATAPITASTRVASSTVYPVNETLFLSFLSLPERMFFLPTSLRVRGRVKVAKATLRLLPGLQPCQRAGDNRLLGTRSSCGGAAVLRHAPR
jgi:hypothetical protein